MSNNLDALFNPRNIAVVGASSNPLKAGYIILDNLLSIGYPKKIFPINVSEKEILGIKCYKKLSEVEEKVELVILITPSEVIFDIMADLEIRMKKKNDVKVIVCAAANYGETKTPEGIRRQDCLINTAKRYGIRVVGPNCIGIIDNINRVDTTFVETLLPKESRGKKGGISFISQSGALAASILMMGASQPAPISMNKFISIGNMADVDFIDLLEYFEQDEDTKVIGMYMEGYPDGRKLIDTLARIAKKKPIIVLKVGRSEIGAKAANSHTGSLAGADAVYEAAFRQYGIIRVYTIEEMMDTLQSLDSGILPKGNNVFILTQAGGPGIYCTDAYMDEKILKLPVVEEKTKKKLTEILPDMANVCSPEGYADITAAANVYHHVESLRTVMDDDGVDSVIFITVVPTFLPRKELAEGLVKLLKNEGYAKKKPVYICIMAGNYVWECRKILEENGIRTYNTPAHCVKAAAHMVEYKWFLDSVRGVE
ncbi:acetate--CoA ligase family protein [Lutispora sp.]|uniref:acetate--CoA ligase family protein n=1 Tax=Lutispora sp. TaxID=2828727 RepID=UPI002B20CCFA|nr:CoA-binding protein [Lutispora sp.]MEA4963188.1 CoA-binding protein [Lutispora sp.]